MVNQELKVALALLVLQDKPERRVQLVNTVRMDQPVNVVNLDGRVNLAVRGL